jgi:alkanesulfonate monooxygenase SsuD/methylene tetrahydromethanopterin reductase-like flavin-dependent oxidoreductase (luciferase family)
LVFECVAIPSHLLGHTPALPSPDPVRVREEIARYRERLGVTTIICRLQWPGMDQAKVLRSIRLLGEKVLPRLAG